MSTPHVLDELSAYVDGESRAPEKIARHLQSCPACAQRHLELLKLSTSLKAMRAPEVSPAFLTRVLARTEENVDVRPWYAAMTPRFAAVACVVLFVAIAGWRWLPADQSPTAPGVESTPLQVNIAWRDDAQVIEAFSQLLDEGATLDVFGDVDEAADLEESPPVPLELVLELLAEDASEGDLSDPYSPDELTGLMEELAEEDVQLLSELLYPNGNEV